MALESAEIPEGQNAEFYCKATGYPRPTILWRKAGESIESENRFIINYSEQELETESTLVVLDVIADVDDTEIVAIATSESGEAYSEADLFGQCALCVLTN